MEFAKIHSVESLRGLKVENRFEKTEQIVSSETKNKVALGGIGECIKNDILNQFCSPSLHVEILYTKFINRALVKRALSDFNEVLT